MLQLLWIVPALPLLGFVVLFVSAGRLPKPAVAAVGVGSTGLAVGLAAYLIFSFLSAPPAGEVYRETLWQWIAVGHFHVRVAFELDPISLVMLGVVTFVGFLIHLYSAEFMQEDAGYNRFFAYMNLFVGSMLVLVLADNLLLLYAGWEGVGLCSYLLIGFWYRDSYNGYAARKAFIVTRIGDTALIVGLFLLFNQLGTLEISTLMQRAQQSWTSGSLVANAAAALLLGGALGKSAQLPLQTWLPDAMAGPTPVSALIHAATMVTAGVYLIARTHVLFQLAPPVQLAVAIIGAATLLLGAVNALRQHDIKRVLAYSTISQIGYMFLGLGVGAWTAAMFHLMTHACFKALLFLAAGAVMMRIEDEHDIYRMGGLRKPLPLAFWTFLIGSASLAALPVVTAGFYSKDMILWGAWRSTSGGVALWTAGIVGAFLTALYIFRVVFIVFFGRQRRTPSGRYGWRIGIPLIVLAALSIGAGFLDTPPGLAHIELLTRFLSPALPQRPETFNPTQTILMGIAGLVALLGVAVAVPGRRMLLFRSTGAALDWLYDRVLVWPFLRLTRLNREDFIDSFYDAIAFLSRVCYALLSWIQNGHLRRYAAWIAAGSLGAIAIALFA